MNPSGLRFFLLLAASIFLVFLAPATQASVDRNHREVLIVFVEGDVRLSRGHANHPDLKLPWEAPQTGQPIEQGFALATGNGRAEIEFENGSTVFLAENSLLLFAKLSSSGDRIITHVALPTGSATFWVPSAAESFFIETATDKVQIIGPETSSLRFDAYLDATGITPLGGKLGSIKGAPTLQVASGKTVFFQGGAVLSAPEPDENLPWKESADGTPDPEVKFENYPFRAGEQRLVRSDWDQWVEARLQEKKNDYGRSPQSLSALFSLARINGPLFARRLLSL
jgi:FecR protein